MAEIFKIAAPEIGAPYQEGDIDIAEDHFRKSGADQFTYLVQGKELWIEVLFEKHEGYYG